MSVEPDGTEKYHDGGRGMCFLSSQFITVIISHVSENPEDGVSYTKWASQGSCCTSFLKFFILTVCLNHESLVPSTHNAVMFPRGTSLRSAS